MPRRLRGILVWRKLGNVRPGSVDPEIGIASFDLRAAMLRLDPDDRALVAMRYGVGFDSNELAIATGKTPAAVRQRLERALDRLRKDLTDGGHAGVRTPGRPRGRLVAWAGACRR